MKHLYKKNYKNYVKMINFIKKIYNIFTKNTQFFSVYIEVKPMSYQINKGNAEHVLQFLPILLYLAFIDNINCIRAKQPYDWLDPYLTKEKVRINSILRCIWFALFEMP